MRETSFGDQDASPRIIKVTVFRQMGAEGTGWWVLVEVVGGGEGTGGGDGKGGTDYLSLHYHSTVITTATIFTSTTVSLLPQNCPYMLPYYECIAFISLTLQFCVKFNVFVTESLNIMEREARDSYFHLHNPEIEFLFIVFVVER